MTFKTILTDINDMVVAIDKISQITVPDYTGFGKDIEKLTAKQAALVLSTKKISQEELEEVVIQNKLLEKYGAIELIKSGLLATNSSLIASEKILKAEELEEILVKKGVNQETAKRLIQQNLQIVTNGNATASVVMLNKALMDEAIKKGILTKENAAELLSSLGVVAADKSETGSKKSLAAATWELVKANIALLTSNPVGMLATAVAAIGAAIYTVVKIADALTISLDEQKEILQETKDAYESVKNELKDIENQIQSTQSAIDELSNTPHPSWVDQAELNRLREVTKELQLQKQLKEEATLEAAKDLYKENEATYNKEFKSTYGNTSIDDLVEQLSLGNIGVGHLDLTGNITDIIAALQYALTVENEIADREQFIEGLIAILKINGKEYLSSLSEYKQNILEIANIEGLTDEEQAFYDQLSSMQKMIYEFYSPETWNTIEFDSIFDTEGLEKTKEELIEMAKEGTLDESIIQSYSKLNSILEDSNLILREDQSAASALCDEIYTLAEAEKEIDDNLHNNKTGISLSSWQSSLYSPDQTYSDLIKDWESQTKQLQSVLSDIRSGDTAMTAADIVSQFPDLQPYIEQFDDLALAVDTFMRDSYEELLDKFSDTSNIEGFSYELEYLQGILNEGLGGANNIDHLVSTYEELIGILDQVNSDYTFTEEEIVNLINKYDALKDAVITTTDGYKLEDGALIDLINNYISLSNTAISNQIELTRTTIEGIEARVKAWGMEIEALKTVAKIYNATGGSEEAVGQYIYDNYGTNLTSATPAIIAAATEYAAAGDQLNGLLEQLNNSYTAGSKYKAGGSSSSEKDFEETFNWIETAIDRIERSISNLDRKASSTYRSWSERNSNLKAQLQDVRKEIDIQTSGYHKYMQMASSVGLSEEWASKVRNGQIDSNTITNEGLAKQIKQYQEYYENALKCQDAVAQLNETVSELYKTAFDNIASQFDSIISVVENSKSMLDEYINQAEESGYIANAAYYEALMDVERKNIEQLTKEKAALQSSLADAVNSGAITEGSQAWADMQSQINDVTLSIEEANTAMIRYGNSIRDIQWQIFDLIQDRISRISSESDFLIDLLSNTKLYDDRGQFTDAGKSTAGLHGMNYNVYMAQADKYAQEILRIDEELAKDPYNQDLAERRQELLELQQEMILAAEDEKQAIVDMVEKGINLELNALKELIDSYADALDAQKDLYDYQKNIANQTKEIASLQKQLSAYEGDLSEEARAKIQEIKVKLDNAQEELEETEYERYISDQRQLLDELYLEYETALNQRLDNIDALIADMITEINNNANTINDTLSSTAASVGYELSETMKSVWSSGTNSMLDALAMYNSNVAGGFADINTSVGEVIRGVTETVLGIGNVNTTITNAINSVTGNMQAILNKLTTGSTTQAASAAGSSSGSTSSGSSASGSGGSSGSGFFVYSKDNYPKNQLNINTSIIDRLKYHDYDSSFSARKAYYSQMGLPGVYTGTSEQNAQMLNWMKANGYRRGVFNLKRNEWAWTQEGRKPEVIVRSSDGAILTPLAKGDSVLNADATRNLFHLTHDPQDFIQDQFRNVPIPQKTKQDTIHNNVQLSVELPNVQNYEQFKYAMQHDKQIERMFQAMTVGKAAGGSSLKKYKV